MVVASELHNIARFSAPIMYLFLQCKRTLGTGIVRVKDVFCLGGKP